MTDPRPSSNRPLLRLGDDGSSPAETAWRWVTNHAWPGWHVEVLTADTEGKPVQWGQPPRREEWTPTWDRRREVEGAADVRFYQVATDPRAMLAEEEGVDLLVVGLRTHSFLQGVATGSTTEWLLHHPPAPLVVARLAEPVDRAVVCVDGSEQAQAALAAFAGLPLASTSTVTVLAVADGRADVDAAVSGATQALEGRVAEVSTVIREGAPTSEILTYLDEGLPELVVLGTRGLTGWQRLQLGSTASAVVRGAPCTSLIA